MNITEAIDGVAFKHALFEGKVEFDYVKTNGETRHAVGTMNESLLPKQEPMVAFKCTEIKWHTEEPWPSRKTVYVPKAKVDGLNEAELKDLVADMLPDACGCGFVVESFKLERVEKNGQTKKLPDGTVFYYDLEKGGYRSFKLANLKNWKSC